LIEKIRQIHEQNRGVYGAPRIHAELRLEHDIHVGRRRVARLMKAAGIAGVRPRKRWRTTIRIPGITPATDLVERQFRPDRPNVLWVADITYLRTGEGWLYLAAVQDTYPARSSAGRWPPTCAQAWSSTRSTWRSYADARSPG
jgi:putative transposase